MRRLRGPQVHGSATSTDVPVIARRGSRAMAAAEKSWFSCADAGVGIGDGRGRGPAGVGGRGLAARVVALQSFKAAGDGRHHFAGRVAAEVQLHARRQTGNIELEGEVVADGPDFRVRSGTTVESLSCVHGRTCLQSDGQPIAGAASPISFVNSHGARLGVSKIRHSLPFRATRAVTATMWPFPPARQPHDHRTGGCDVRHGAHTAGRASRCKSWRLSGGAL